MFIFLKFSVAYLSKEYRLNFLNQPLRTYTWKVSEDAFSTVKGFKLIKLKQNSILGYRLERIKAT